MPLKKYRSIPVKREEVHNNRKEEEQDWIRRGYHFKTILGSNGLDN